jgi:hypothetical protein
MIQTLDNTLEYKLIDTENTQIKLSSPSDPGLVPGLNENQFASIKRSMHTVSEIESGKFRRRFDRHRTAYRFFN